MTADAPERSAAALAAFTAELHTAPDLDAVLQRILAFGSSMIACDSVAIVLQPGYGVDWRRWGPSISAGLRFRSVLSAGIGLRDQDVGVLNFYAVRCDAFQPADQILARALAVHSAVAIAVVTTCDTLHRAIDAHTEIGQAVGIVMERFGVGDDEALALLRCLSQEHNVELRTIAAEVVAERRGAARLSRSVLARSTSAHGVRRLS